VRLVSIMRAMITTLMGAFVLSIPEHKLRVYAPDVGGGFGSKIYHYAEEAFVTVASKVLNRPVKWTSTRSEAFITDAHGRDHVTKAELAIDAEGKIRAMFTNTVPVDAYRGAGRPEATYLLERIIDKAAREMNISPVELRRRNFIRDFPYATPVAVEYDTGDYDATLNKALEVAKKRPRAASCAAWGCPVISRRAALHHLRWSVRWVRGRAFMRRQPSG